VYKRQLQHSQLSGFSTKRNCVIQHINTVMIMKVKGWPMKGVRDSLILTLIGEAGFITLVRGTCFLIISRTKEEDIQILISILIIFLLLMGVMMLSQPYFGSRKLIIYLMWSIPMEDHFEFVVHKLKGRIVIWWDRFQNMCMY